MSVSFVSSLRPRPGFVRPLKTVNQNLKLPTFIFPQTYLVHLGKTWKRRKNDMKCDKKDDDKHGTMVPWYHGTMVPLSRIRLVFFSFSSPFTDCIYVPVSVTSK